MLFLILLFSLMLSACAPESAVAQGGAPTVDAQQLETAVANLQAGTATAAAVLPTGTALPQPTPEPSPTATPEPFPMEITAMRAGEYPGSDIVIEATLEPGANYYRYYAYYLSEGLKIYGLLTVPYAQMPESGYPAIVFNHGYIPPDVYVTTERYIAYVDNLARSGYVVFRIDYRGHDRSEGDASGAYSNPGYQVDVLNAVSSLQRHPQVNPEKIGMWGHSMGGYLTLRAMVISDQVKVGVIWAGVVGSYPDMLNNWRRGSSAAPRPTSRPGARRWRDEWIAQYGEPSQNPAFWNSISANAYLADLSGPVQLHHGTLDEDVPVEFSETLYQQILDVGGMVELYTYPGDNHNISNYFSAAMQHTIEFYDRYLKN
jgi:fermentation-respiration switch protein FrsA (DUF1100 family)